MHPTEDLIPILEKLRLSGVLQTLDMRLRQVVVDDVPHSEFLLRLLSDEVERRDAKRSVSGSATGWNRVPDLAPHGPLELPAITTLLESQLRAAAPHRLSWMTLLARVFRIDISVCARCAGPMRVTRAVTTPEDIAAELRGARPPPRPSPPGQLLLFSLA